MLRNERKPAALILRLPAATVHASNVVDRNLPAGTGLKAPGGWPMAHMRLDVREQT
jgi:hypothetical protein